MSVTSAPAARDHVNPLSFRTAMDFPGGRDRLRSKAGRQTSTTRRLSEARNTAGPRELRTAGDRAAASCATLPGPVERPVVREEPDLQVGRDRLRAGPVPGDERRDAARGGAEVVSVPVEDR